MQEIKNLEAVYDSRKSFYGKAKVITEMWEDGVIHTIKLQSYRTIVAKIDVTEADRTATVFGTYSATTLRHIKEFLRQYGFEANGKAQIEQDYISV